MIAAVVLTGQGILMRGMDVSLKKASEGYDSVGGITQGTKVFIIYDNGRCYPAFIITYQ